jgi:hypothetical protein
VVTRAAAAGPADTSAASPAHTSATFGLNLKPNKYGNSLISSYLFPESPRKTNAALLAMSPESSSRANQLLQLTGEA